MLNIEERFWNKVDKTSGHGPEGDCWLWTKSTDDGGYGWFRYGTRGTRAHRFSWDLHNPRKPCSDLCVLHTCDNPGCVNPSHLFLGTQLDNLKDMMDKGRDRHPKGTCNGRSKLIEDQVLGIYTDPRTQDVIATDYSVHRTQVSRIKHGKTWAHITGHTQC